MLRLLALGCFAILSYAQQTYIIAGHVVRSLNQRPATRVQVSIALLNEPARQISAITGDEGQFVFQSVPAGKYQLRVNEHGVTQLYRQLDQYSTAIVTGPNLDTEHILFALESPASLSGKILDDDNEPAPNMSVYLFYQALMAGKYQTRSRSQVTTDTSGAFHFHGLAPGTYFVAVTGRPWYAQNTTQGEQHSELDLAYPITYYAGATSAEGATALKLMEGQKAEVQMSVHAVPALHVKVDGLITANQRQHGIYLMQSGPGGAAIPLPTMIGNSELLGIAPGRYTVSFPSFDRSTATDVQTVNLSGDTSIQLTNAPTASVKGRLILPNAESTTRPHVLLRDNATGAFSSGTVEVGADGTFEMHRVPAGHYSLRLANGPDSFLAKVEVKGANYAGGELDIAAGAQIELVLTGGHGLAKVAGTVMQDKNRIPGAMVLLIPQAGNQAGSIARDQSDSDGSFEMGGVVPGKYTLVAIDDGRGLAYADPTAIAAYLKHGQVVDIPLNKEVVVEVQHRLQ